MGEKFDTADVADALETTEQCDEARDEEEEMEHALSEGRRELGCDTAGEMVE